MPKPARLPTRHIEVNRLQAEPLSKLLGGYVVVPGVLARDPAHSAQALCMEAAESPPQYLSLREAPAFTAELPKSPMERTSRSYTARFASKDTEFERKTQFRSVPKALHAGSRRLSTSSASPQYRVGSTSLGSRTYRPLASSAHLAAGCPRGRRRRMSLGRCSSAAAQRRTAPLTSTPSRTLNLASESPCPSARSAPSAAAPSSPLSSTHRAGNGKRKRNYETK